MKITLVVGYLAKGGTERQVAYLSSGLVALGHEVDVLLLGHRLADEYPVAPGVNVRALQITKLPHLVSGVRALKEAFRDSDLVYSFLDLANAICALCKPRYGSILVWGLRAANTSRGGLPRLGFWLSRLFCKRADAMIANSQAVRAYYRQQAFDCKNFWVVANGVKTASQAGNPPRLAREQCRSELGLPGGAFVALVLARVAEEKRQELGLDLLESNPDLQLVYAGDGASELPDLWHNQGLVDAGLLPRCRFIEHQNDLGPLFVAADVLLSMSSSEGFPNAILEAMAQGLPVVATAVGGVVELLDTQSTGGRPVGWLVPASNRRDEVEGLAQALLQVQAGGGLVQERAQSARLRVEDNFGVDRMVERTVAHLVRVLEA